MSNYVILLFRPSSNLPPARDWTVSPPNPSICWSSNPCAYIRDCALGRWLKINWVIRGEPWSARTSTTKETSEFSLYNVKTMRKVAVCKPGRQPFPEPAQASTLILDFPASRTVWLNFCSWNFYGTPSWLIYHPTQSKSQSPSSSQRSPARSGLSCPQPLTLSELTTFGIS